MNADGLDIPKFLKRKKPEKKLEIEATERKIEWAPISRIRRRSAMLENMRKLVKDPTASVTASLKQEGGEFVEKKFKNMDAFLDDFYNERVHQYLGINANTIYVDVSGETKMKKRFKDLKSRRNSAHQQGERTMAAKKKVKKVKKVVEKKSDPRYDGKKLTRILQKDLPEGTKPLQKTSPHWNAYIYVARRPGGTFEDYASTKHSIASLTTLVEAGHVVVK